MAQSKQSVLRHSSAEALSPLTHTHSYTPAPGNGTIPAASVATHASAQVKVPVLEESLKCQLQELFLFFIHRLVGTRAIATPNAADALHLCPGPRGWHPCLALRTFPLRCPCGPRRRLCVLGGGAARDAQAADSGEEGSKGDGRGANRPGREPLAPRGPRALPLSPLPAPDSCRNFYNFFWFI
jgi:hypothetical protein